MFPDVGGARDVDDLTFIRMKLHLPFLGPLLKLIQVVLKGDLVRSRSDGTVDDRVISEESDLRGDVAVDIVDKHQKQEGAEH